MTCTIVSFHAHPDDEALLTGGTLARLAGEGHRVVLVCATAGEAGLADRAGDDLGVRRRRELEASAAALGVARVVVLGYADSGFDVPSGATAPFADVPPDEPAAALAEVLREERADVLTGYDEHGGYGHRDHVQVHRVARLAAELAGTPLLLEATLDRDRLAAVVGVLRRVSRWVPLPQLPDVSHAFTRRADITHRVDVRRHLPAKRRALAAHASQATGGPRTVALLLRLPGPLSSRVLGTEWFVQVRRGAARPVADPLASSRVAQAETARRGRRRTSSRSSGG